MIDNMIDLDAIEARASVATEPPWKHLDDEIVGPEIPDMPRGFRPYDTIAMADELTDREFIAHARTDIPTLIAEIRRLQNRLDEVTKASEEYVTRTDSVFDEKIQMSERIDELEIENKQLQALLKKD